MSFSLLLQCINLFNFQVQGDISSNQNPKLLCKYPANSAHVCYDENALCVRSKKGRAWINEDSCKET